MPLLSININITVPVKVNTKIRQKISGIRQRCSGFISSDYSTLVNKAFPLQMSRDLHQYALPSVKVIDEVRPCVLVPILPKCNASRLLVNSLVPITSLSPSIIQKNAEVISANSLDYYTLTNPSSSSFSGKENLNDGRAQNAQQSESAATSVFDAGITVNPLDLSLAASIEHHQRVILSQAAIAQGLGPTPARRNGQGQGTSSASDRRGDQEVQARFFSLDTRVRGEQVNNASQHKSPFYADLGLPFRFGPQQGFYPPESPLAIVEWANGDVSCTKDTRGLGEEERLRLRYTLYLRRDPDMIKRAVAKEVKKTSAPSSSSTSCPPPPIHRENIPSDIAREQLLRMAHSELVSRHSYAVGAGAMLQCQRELKRNRRKAQPFLVSKVGTCSTRALHSTLSPSYYNALFPSHSNRTSKSTASPNLRIDLLSNALVSNYDTVQSCRMTKQTIPPPHHGGSNNSGIGYSCSVVAGALLSGDKRGSGGSAFRGIDEEHDSRMLRVSFESGCANNSMILRSILGLDANGQAQSEATPQHNDGDGKGGENIVANSAADATPESRKSSPTTVRNLFWDALKHSEIGRQYIALRESAFGSVGQKSSIDKDISCEKMSEAESHDVYVAVGTTTSSDGELSTESSETANSSKKAIKRSRENKDDGEKQTNPLNVERLSAQSSACLFSPSQLRICDTFDVMFYENDSSDEAMSFYGFTLGHPLRPYGHSTVPFRLLAERFEGQVVDALSLLLAYCDRRHDVILACGALSRFPRRSESPLESVAEDQSVFNSTPIPDETQRLAAATSITTIVSTIINSAAALLRSHINQLCKTIHFALLNYAAEAAHRYVVVAVRNKLTKVRKSGLSEEVTEALDFLYYRYPHRLLAEAAIKRLLLHPRAIDDGFLFPPEFWPTFSMEEQKTLGRQCAHNTIAAVAQCKKDIERAGRTHTWEEVNNTFYFKS